MTVGTFFGDIGMFINERALIFHMTTCTQGFACDALEVLGVGGIVRVMAVGASHLVLGNRVMRKLGKFHFDLYVATGTEVFLVKTTNFLLGALMQFVTIKTTDIVKRVHAGIPVGQVWRGRRRVTSQTGHRLGLSGELGEG